MVPAGRRSGKTELAKRQLVRCCYLPPREDARYFAGAPTRDQAKAIYWSDLKAMVPKELMAGAPSESHLVIPFITGSELHVVGMDRPERIEGRPWDGGVLDEYANMKPGAWPENVRPALSDRRGWCWLIGVPEGRNHYYDLYKYAISGIDDEWDGFTWKSIDILPPEEVEAAKRQLDPLTFEQEYEASFINFAGRAYYPFDDRVHCAPLHYDPQAPLVFCFDFNVEPGTAVVCQEQELPSGETGTGVIGEVYIPRNSNTRAVCRKLVEDWRRHGGRIMCYGDATGGARGSAKVQGSDWDLIKEELSGFGAQVHYRVPQHNPQERARINAVNTRLRSGDGLVRLMVDPVRAPNVVKDFEGVRLLEGGSGEIDKRHDLRLTHLTDGVGYYIAQEFPVIRERAEQVDMYARG